jgi:uncharacterized protein YidB (DUF937 family)
MGLLDQLASAATQAARQTNATSGQADLLSLVQPVLERFGGVQGLLNQLQSGGLGEAVQTWLSQGNNQAITGSQLQAALGEDTVANLAQQTGVPTSGLSDQLAQLLPQVVDQLSPGGQLSQSGMPDMGALGGLLGGLLRR